MILVTSDNNKAVNSLKKIYAWEPWFFIFFGLFHMHRIWGLIDRQSYADFWLGVLAEKGFLYFALMGILAVLCVCGMVVFFRHLKNNYWWRWIYLFGGGYLLFDLFAIAIDLKVWSDLLAMMFDVGSPWWNLIWGFFILLGTSVLGLGFCLLRQRREQAKG
ncbi:MAG: hypothetical protein E7320_06135 [Clostridiales bacterium]|nr:hypothetical protein [Clostridiales bacterium]